MTDAEKLEVLRSRLSPLQGECVCCAMPQQELFNLLQECGGDVDAASYKACLRLAECTALKTPEIETESMREYWLSLARLYRPNRNCAMVRSDEGSGR